MNDYVITCTSTCDLTKEILTERDNEYLCFKMIANDKEYDDNFYADYPYEQFYADIKNGLMPTTSQVGYGSYLELFERNLMAKKDVLHICLSGGLSGDYTTAFSIAQQLNEKYENKVYVVDSLAASSGYGMLVMMADDNRDKGMSFADNCKWLEENKLTVHHWFISSDLSSYVRGGRISKTAGLFGTALKICPLMNVSKNGSLNPVEKIRTKGKAMEGQINKMVELASNGLQYSDRVYISHSLCEEDALKLKTMIMEKFVNVKDVQIFRIGMTIGAHTGPGTIALFFLGSARD